MPDIAMCLNEKCPDKESCYRWTATENPFTQSYGSFGKKDGEESCEYFWPAKDTENAAKR